MCRRIVLISSQFSIVTAKFRLPHLAVCTSFFRISLEFDRWNGSLTVLHEKQRKIPTDRSNPYPTHLSYTLISHRIIYFESLRTDKARTASVRAFNFVIIIPVYPGYLSLSPRFDVDEKKRILPFLLPSLSLSSNSGSNDRCSWSPNRVANSNPYRAEINIVVASSQDERAERKRIYSNNKFPLES